MPAPSLPELQALFWNALHGDVAPALEAAAISTPGLNGRARLGIYAGMYHARLRDVLASDFERTEAVLGTEAFTEAARRYIAAEPSTHPSVRHFGRRFAGFLAAAPPPGAPPWLADLARLEWARLEVFDAPDAAPVGRDALDGLPADAWPGLTLVAIPALVVVESRWPIDRAWKGEPIPGLRPTAVRVWRQDGRVFHAAMDHGEPAALAALRAGRPFAEICEAMALSTPEPAGAEAATEAGALLARWLDDGLIAAVV